MDKLSAMRWKILRDVVTKRVNSVTATSASAASVRRFRGFDTFNVIKISESITSTQLKDVETQNCEWYAYSFARNEERGTITSEADEHIYVRHLIEVPNAADLIGFDNTGNVCVWPAEELLAAYCVKNASQIFNPCSVVLELGGGMTCLAGLAVARFVSCARVLLTDGNERSIENLNEIIRLNREKSLFAAGSVEAQMLRWNDVDASMCNTFDVIICADCLFFDAFREALALCIAKTLKIGGVAVLMAPKRGQTMNDFLKYFTDDAALLRECAARSEVNGLTDELDARFEVSVTERYSEHVWSRHVLLIEQNEGLYDPDLHYSFLIVISKKKRDS